jgi:transcriptional regulator with XRE-family HTH domain
VIHTSKNTPNQVSGKGDQTQLVAALREAMRKHRVSMRQLSDDLAIPYRSIQNYFSGESRLPADVLIAICRKVGLEVDYLAKGSFQVSHYELLDAVQSALGDVLQWLDFSPAGKMILRSAPAPDTSSQLSVAHILAAKINEEYARFRAEWLEKGTLPPITSAEFIGSVKRRRSK